MSEATCDYCKRPKAVPKGCDQGFHCPDCGLIVMNPDRQKRSSADFGVGAVIGDTDKWNPYCAGLGELDRAKIPGRIKDGTLRVNPKTGNLEGYFDTHAKYRQALKDQGVINNHGEGEINEARQGWDPQYRDKQ